MGTHYTKFINRLFRRGLRTKYINFFYMLSREHKRQIHAICKWKLGNTYDIVVLSTKFKIISFGDLVTSVFRMLILQLELKVRRYRKKEIFVPIPVAPWRGFRLGLTFFLKNVKNRIQHIKVHRKVEYFHKLLGELWDTYYGESATSRTILEFTENVLAKSENYRSARFHPVREGRRQPVQDNKVEIEVKVKYNEKRIRFRAVELGYLKKIRRRRRQESLANYKSYAFFKMTSDMRNFRKRIYFRGYRRHARKMGEKMRYEKKHFFKLFNRWKGVTSMKSSDKFRERWVKRLSVNK